MQKRNEITDFINNLDSAKYVRFDDLDSSFGVYLKVKNELIGIFVQKDDLTFKYHDATLNLNFENKIYKISLSVIEPANHKTYLFDEKYEIKKIDINE